MSTQSNFRIPFKDAVKYIKAYRDHFELDKVGRNPDVMNCIGGTLKVYEIKNQIKEIKRQRQIAIANSLKSARDQISYQGLMCWACQAPKENIINEHICLAIEAHDDVDLDDDNQKIDNQILTRPFDVITYNKADHSDIEAWLKKNRPISGKFRDLIKRGKDDTEGAKKLIKQYKTRIKDFEPSNSNRPYGLFENEYTNDVDDLLGDEVVYLRYYFGFDDSKSVNKIRIILFGVDGSGNNLIPDETQEIENQSTGPIILQNSWPPKTNP